MTASTDKIPLKREEISLDPATDPAMFSAKGSHLDQIIDETKTLLSIFKCQINDENTDASHRVQSHAQMQDSWTKIKIICMDLQSSPHLSTMQTIEYHLSTLSNESKNFKDLEFQFPFHLTTFIATLKKEIGGMAVSSTNSQVSSRDGSTTSQYHVSGDGGCKTPTPMSLKCDDTSQELYPLVMSPANSKPPSTVTKPGFITSSPSVDASLISFRNTSTSVASSNAPTLIRKEGSNACTRTGSTSSTATSSIHGKSDSVDMGGTNPSMRHLSVKNGSAPSPRVEARSNLVNSVNTANLTMKAEPMHYDGQDSIKTRDLQEITAFRIPKAESRGTPKSSSIPELTVKIARIQQNSKNSISNTARFTSKSSLRSPTSPSRPKSDQSLISIDHTLVANFALYATFDARRKRPDSKTVRPRARTYDAESPIASKPWTFDQPLPQSPIKVYMRKITPKSPAPVMVRKTISMDFELLGRPIEKEVEAVFRKMSTVNVDEVLAARGSRMDVVGEAESEEDVRTPEYSAFSQDAFVFPFGGDDGDVGDVGGVGELMVGKARKSSDTSILTIVKEKKEKAVTGFVGFVRNVEPPLPPKKSEHLKLSVFTATNVVKNRPVVNRSSKPQSPLTSLDLKTNQLEKVDERRNEVASVMYTDRAYVLGLMTAFDNDPTPPKPTIVEPIVPHREPSKEFIYGDEIDKMFQALDRGFMEGFKGSTWTGSGDIIGAVDEGLVPSVVTELETKPKLHVDTALLQNETVEPVGEVDRSRSSKKEKIIEPEIGTFMVPSRLHDPSSSRDVHLPDDPNEYHPAISTSSLLPWKTPMSTIQVLLVPLNAMFDMEALDMSFEHRMGRGLGNNSDGYEGFMGFATLVVSRKHLDLFQRDGSIFIRDVGSNSGTFRNNARLSLPGQVSPDVQLVTGDYVQLGKDFQDDTPLDAFGRIQFKKRCIRFQVIIIPVGSNAVTVVKSQSIPIESPVNLSQLLSDDSADLRINSSPTSIPHQLYYHKGSASAGLHTEFQAIASAAKEQLRNRAMEHFVISYTVSAGKVTKLQVTGAQGILVMEVNLKKWDEKGRFTIIDSRVDGQPMKVFLKTKPGAKSPAKLKAYSTNLPWQVTYTNGTSIGQMTFLNDIKLELNPVEPLIDSSTIALTGDFREQRYICVKKWTNSRQQARFGECKGRFKAKSSFIDAQWLINFDMQDSRSNKLVLCGAILSILLSPS